jgi:hypothetical protein
MTDEGPIGPEDPDDLDVPPPFFPGEADGASGMDYGELVLVEVESVFATTSEAEDIERAYVLLSSGERKLPIVIGPCEAASITFALEGHRHSRPLTHDLLKTVLERMEMEIARVLVDDLWKGTFYGKIVLRGTDGREEVVDCRPSDAIALAVRCDAPIYVAEGILDRGHV